MKIEIKHRFTGVVIYSCDVSDDEPRPLRAAVVQAIGTRANLADANLARANLADANLADANLAGANLADANLADAYLADANLAGANLADANLADAYLADANLADANLARANLADAYLADANLADANLAGANLAGANLADANLADANLADARNVPMVSPVDPAAVPYQRATTPQEQAARAADRAARYRERHPEVPVVPHLDRKILDVVEAGTGRLDMSQWHTCETTHCRAGWAIRFAGEAGAALEAEYGPHRAGSMIYRASTGRVPHFFATTERALEDIRACAAVAS
jgi:hypothetical protein